MQLEFHQLDRRLENLRVRQPARQRHLLASLAESGQQTPIIVIEQQGRYLVIDGHKRLVALQQLGRDTVEALVWEMSEAEALVLERSMRTSRPETALEQGWLLAEMESRLGCSIEELARRFDRSRTWVTSRLALVEALPPPVQQLVREGKIAPAIAMRYLTPRQHRALPTPGGGLRRRRPTVDHAASRRTVSRLAPRQPRPARTHGGRAGALPQGTTTRQFTGKTVAPDRRPRATGAGGVGIAAAGELRCAAPARPRHRTVA